MNFSSKLIESAVESFTMLPGVGKKSALRMVLHLLKKDASLIQTFASNIADLQEINECEICHNYSDEKRCGICNDQSRDSSTICLVESIRDVMAIEDTNQFRGRYHIIGGVISPIDGIGPDQLNIASLLNRIELEEVREVIMAINPTIEGETTIYYISKKLKDYGVNVSTLARGVAFGSELEYADELTLARSIMTRTPYNVVK